MQEIRLPSAQNDARLPDPGQRQFLKTLLGTAAGLAGVATAGALLTPAPAEAAYANGTAPDGGDLVNTNLWIQGNTTIKGPHPWIDVRTYGAVGNGITDDRTAIQNAINALGSDGGTIFFPAGFVFRCNSSLILDNRQMIRLFADHSGEEAQALTTPNLLYTGTGSNFISLHSSRAIIIEGLRIVYNNSGFTGSLIDCDWSAAQSDVGMVRIEHCLLSGTDEADNAKCLVRFNNTICSSVTACWLRLSEVGVLGRDSGYSNVIQIRDCTFRDQSVSAIRNAVESWLIEGCTFEPRTNGTAGAYTQDLSQYAWGLNFIGNWFGDASGGGTWIDAKCLGANLAGNRFAGAGSGSICIKLTQSEGVNVSGNHIECPIGIDVSGFAIGLAVMGNKFFGVTTPVNNTGSISPTTAAFLGNSGLANYIA